jgi:hypothetical protein
VTEKIEMGNDKEKWITQRPIKKMRMKSARMQGTENEKITSGRAKGNEN